ncbi:hypothetical protein Cyrtocomes_01235 [Candidatus Cyrtobacter comes]|uniref:Uncharacterized protein n=1 Tax=Candidatus Cyrtobacter comes TaxID=675776 RepID=A0ABU5L9N9_9RICK|nr:hypothetical protein [Candidatus Cyrtobacter comes]MDZ5762839.1 hypothetical protein [Candidatus Cyrtobacter comes]
MILFGGGVYSGSSEPVDSILSYTKNGIVSDETALEFDNFKIVAGSRDDARSMHSIIKLRDGFILGFLFEKRTNKKVTSFSDDLVRKIIESDGKYLGTVNKGCI